MKIYFRCEASPHIGFGHLRRCLVLARALYKAGAQPVFILTDDDNAARSLIGAEGFHTHAVPAAAGIAQEAASYPSDCRFLVTDLVHRDFQARPDILCRYLESLSGRRVFFLDGMFDDAFRPAAPVPEIFAVLRPYPGAEGDTTNLRARHAMTGGQYTILPSEYADIPARHVAEKAHNLLLAFGGADPQGLTEQVLRAVIDEEFSLYVVIGPYFAADHADQIRSFSDRCKIIENCSNLLPHYLRADMVCGAASLSRFEFAACGLPCIFTALYPQHEKLAVHYAQFGAARYLGRYDTLDAQDWRGAVCDLRDDYAARRAMAQAGRGLVDGKGAARLAQSIIELSGTA